MLRGAVLLQTFEADKDEAPDDDAGDGNYVRVATNFPATFWICRHPDDADGSGKLDWCVPWRRRAASLPRACVCVSSWPLVGGGCGAG